MKLKILFIAIITAVVFLAACSKAPIRTRMEFDLPGPVYYIGIFVSEYKVIYNHNYQENQESLLNDTFYNKKDNPDNFIGSMVFNADHTGWFYLNPNQQNDTCYFTWEPVNKHDFKVYFEDIPITYHAGDSIVTFYTAKMSGTWSREHPFEITGSSSITPGIDGLAFNFSAKSY